MSNRRLSAIAGSSSRAAGPTICGLLIELTNTVFIFLIKVPVCIVGLLMSFRPENSVVKATENRFHGDV
jgi:hypothetical protein